jgi:hypothetical protein
MRLSLTLLLFFFAAGLHAQPTRASGPVEVVALRSKQGAFAGKYNIDTLVYFLNKLNQNGSVRYVRSSEDETETGFYAPYLLDIETTLSPYKKGLPQMSKTLVPRFEIVETIDANGTIRRTPTNRILRSPIQEMKVSAPQPGIGDCWVTIREKSKNEQKTRFSFRVITMENEDLSLKMLVEMLAVMLDERFPPAGARTGKNKPF